VLASLVAALALCAVSLFAGHLRFLHVVPRSRWLSFAGGIGIAYVFVHLLPELAEAQEVFSDDTRAGFVEKHIYLVALAGFTVFYGLERYIKVQRRDEGVANVNESDAAFWVHIASFGLYTTLIGYLVSDRAGELYRLTWFTVAMALHMLVTDYGLHEDHKHIYRRYGRWILAVAVFIGWVIGQTVAVPERVIGLLLGFLAGGVVLNIIKEELPRSRESRVWPFIGGVVIYSLALLAQGRG
jgi:zinc transporter ZupT